MLVTIDPGLDAGWAIFDGKALADCGLDDPRASRYHVGVAQVVVESQVIYPRSRARPRDILKLAQGAGRWVGIYSTIGVEAELVEPRTWKGTAPKAVHHPLVWGALTAHEQRIVAEACKGMAPSKRHNVIDAVGLGLWAVKRFGR